MIACVVLVCYVLMPQVLQDPKSNSTVKYAPADLAAKALAQMPPEPPRGRHPYLVHGSALSTAAAASSAELGAGAVPAR